MLTGKARSKARRSLRLPSLMALCVGLLIAVAGGLYAMDWPTENGLLLSNFGWNNRGRPLAGSVFETRDAVRAVEDGTLLFVHQPDSGASPLPSPLGCWAAVDHGDGLISIYGKLNPDRPEPEPERVSRGQVVAEPEPPEGAADPGSFYFSFYDRKERRWVNPSMIIASQEDTVAPVIFSVELRGSSGAINPAQGRRLAQGRYTVVVNAADSQRPNRPPALAPQRIICSVNGMEIGVLAFETWSARDGALTQGGLPVRQIYAPAPGWELGELRLTRGQATLEIIVQDAAGNARNALYRLQVE